MFIDRVDPSGMLTTMLLLLTLCTLPMKEMLPCSGALGVSLVSGVWIPSGVPGALSTGLPLTLIWYDPSLFWVPVMASVLLTGFCGGDLFAEPTPLIFIGCDSLCTLNVRVPWETSTDCIFQVILIVPFFVATPPHAENSAISNRPAIHTITIRK